MNTILKRFAALVTNSTATNFKGAVIRLTAYYTLGVFCILVVFSVAVYILFSQGVERELEIEHGSDEYKEMLEMRNEPLLHEVTENLFDILVVSDIVLLFMTLIVSYLLARKTLAPLAESYQRQKQFVADAAHELRTPLAVLKAGGEVLLQGERTTPQYRQFLMESQDEINRLITLSNDLLFLVRNTEGRVRTVAPFLFNDVCIAQCERLVAYAAQKEVTVSHRVDTAVTLVGNQDDMTRLVLNVLKNAVDYNTRGGSVTLSLEKVHREAVLRITDTGIGIAEEDIPRIFERFFKVDVARTQKATTGSGLGLAIVKEIADAHGGTLRVTSIKSEGTTIELRVPCA
ncbi:HAMP domain-containing histidine kinase [Candidatus Kaiserbacteria bacterium]|nr:MAG: HAMP domain-containing histidine kinase [Candidatus Kaiserbacteria bacterium]